MNILLGQSGPVTQGSSGRTVVSSKVHVSLRDADTSDQNLNGFVLVLRFLDLFLSTRVKYEKSFS